MDGSLFFVHPFKPLVKGTRQSRTTIPASPMMMPAAILPQTMQNHIPTPSANAPTTPTAAARMVFAEK